jgi:hypothetical protein
MSLEDFGIGNREIIFRAWHKKDQRWLHADEAIDKNYYVHFDGGVGCEWAGDVSEDYVLVQYTGLRDKNGKKIFEGDAVIVNGHIDSPKVVRYGEIDAVFGTSLGYNLDMGDELEVIGNVFKNPELLTQEK